jgi:hypothetical protein
MSRQDRNVGAYRQRATPLVAPGVDPSRPKREPGFSKARFGERRVEGRQPRSDTV